MPLPHPAVASIDIPVWPASPHDRAVPDSAPIRNLTRFFRTLSDDTRLRLLRLLAREELTVNELAGITQLAQPRISNHLKILREEGLVEERRAGSWRHYRVDPAALSGLAEALWPALERSWEADGRFEADDKRLAEVLLARQLPAGGSFFDQLAEEWDGLRDSLFGDAFGRAVLRSFLPPGLVVADIGTGTGYVLHLFAGRAKRLIAVDHSEAMLAVARGKARGANLTNVEFRLADIMAAPPLGKEEVHVATLVQVLHHLDDPAVAIGHLAPGIRKGGCLVISDFLEHQQTWLRDRLHHRWLGFSKKRIRTLLVGAGLELEGWEVLPGRFYEAEGQRLPIPDAFTAIGRRPGQ